MKRMLLSLMVMAFTCSCLAQNTSNDKAISQSATYTLKGIFPTSLNGKKLSHSRYGTYCKIFSRISELERFLLPVTASLSYKFSRKLQSNYDNNELKLSRCLPVLMLLCRIALQSSSRSVGSL